MGFDLARFQATQFQARTADVSLPALSHWFAPGAAPVFRVRGLTSEEVARAEAAADAVRVQLISGLVTALAGRSAPAQIQAIKEALGIGDTTPPELVKDMELAVMGTVDPAMGLSDVVRLADAFVGEFRIIVRNIKELTALGKIPAGSADSGLIPASGPA